MDKQVARVILKKAKTYKFGDRRFIKDVPQIVKGDEVDEYRSNGFFHVVMLKSKPTETVATKKPSAAKMLTRTETLEDDEDEEEAFVAPKKKVVAKAAASSKKSGLLKKR